MKKFLLDASVLVPLLLDYGEKLIDIADKASLYATDLTVYEVGNSLWKLVFLLKNISLNDAVEIMDILIELAEKEFIKIVYFNELTPSRIIKLAVARGLTFYDSTYIVAAEKLNAVLATEDKELREKAKEYVKVIAYKQLQENIMPDLQY